MDMPLPKTAAGRPASRQWTAAGPRGWSDRRAHRLARGGAPEELSLPFAALAAAARGAVARRRGNTLRFNAAAAAGLAPLQRHLAWCRMAAVAAMGQGGGPPVGKDGDDPVDLPVS